MCQRCALVGTPALPAASGTTSAARAAGVYTLGRMNRLTFARHAVLNLSGLAYTSGKSMTCTEKTAQNAVSIVTPPTRQHKARAMSFISPPGVGVYCCRCAKLWPVEPNRCECGCQGFQYKKPDKSPTDLCQYGYCVLNGPGVEGGDCVCDGKPHSTRI